MFYVVQLDSKVFKDKIIVPSIWLDKHNTLCLLPPVTNASEVEKLAKAEATPKHGWQMHSVTFTQSFDTYSQAKVNMKKIKPIMVELEEERDDHHYKEWRAKRKRKLPPFLEEYSIGTDDDDEESPKKDKRTTKDNVVPDPLIVKIETVESSKPLETPEKSWLDVSDNKCPSSVNSSFLHENPFQGAESSAFHRSLPNSTPPVTECPCNSSCHKLMFQSLAALQRQVTDNNRILYQILGQLTAQGNGAVNTLQGAPTGIPVRLPVVELSDLQLLNTYLNDEQNFAEAMLHFTGLGGNNPRQVLKRIMETLVSRDLSSKLNWKGRGDKNPFHVYTKIHSLVYQIAKQNPKASYITLSEVEAFMKDWLKTAPVKSLKGPKKSLNQDDKILRC